MTLILIICVLATAAWVLVSLLGRDLRDDPSDSVAGFNRALAALDPSAGRRRRR